MNELEHLRATWRALGEDDPLWAILSDPDKRGGRWDITEFFAAGETEIAAVEASVATLMPQHRHGIALDFGCGVGRLSRALASRFSQVIGVDISASMIAHARRLNADIANLSFVENARSDLRFIDAASVDFLYSVITLQHMPATLQRGYIAEFMRVLAPGGMAIFQVATGHTRDVRGWVHEHVPNAWLNPLRRWRYGNRVAFEMHTIAEADVRAAAAGRQIARVDTDACAGAGFVGRRFYVTA